MLTHNGRKSQILSKKLHPNRASLNAYVVFGEVSSAESAVSLNGHLFEGFHLRVDLVSGPKVGKLVAFN